MKNSRVFLSENFQYLAVKFSIYLNRYVFVMTSPRRLVMITIFLTLRCLLMLIITAETCKQMLLQSRRFAFWPRRQVFLNTLYNKIRTSFRLKTDFLLWSSGLYLPEPRKLLLSWYRCESAPRRKTTLLILSPDVVFRYVFLSSTNCMLFSCPRRTVCCFLVLGVVFLINSLNFSLLSIHPTF